MNSPTDHWCTVYRTKESDAVSWFRPHLDVSLRLLDQAGLNSRSRLIDVGGGASTLVDDLLDRDVSRITILDLSDAALEVARQRLGDRGANVHWLVGDVTRVALPAGAFDYWHDRAVLHFLTLPDDAAAYVAQAYAALQIGGHAVIGGFASDGPQRCSGLPVARREAADIATLFGSEFELIAEVREQHVTPTGAMQSFAYAVLRKLDRQSR
jgi:ubiquinone/menaquinone biosynthesis C-methylase UbiE